MKPLTSYACAAVESSWTSSQHELGLARFALLLPRLGNRRDELRPPAAGYRGDVQWLPVRVQGVMPGGRFVRRIENWLFKETCGHLAVVGLIRL